MGFVGGRRPPFSVCNGCRVDEKAKNDESYYYSTQKKESTSLHGTCSGVDFHHTYLSWVGQGSLTSVLHPPLHTQAVARLLHFVSSRHAGRGAVQVKPPERWQRAAPQPRRQVSAAGVGDLGIDEVEPPELRQQFSLRRRRICGRRRHEGGEGLVAERVA